MSPPTSSICAVDRVIAVDWSGDRSVAGQRKKIWAGVWSSGAWRGKSTDSVTLETGRTRSELTEWLIALSRETPRMVVGIDCCFSFPAWFLAEHGCATVFDFWAAVASGRGEEWLHCDCGDERFWGVVGRGRNGKRPQEFSGYGLRRMMRTTDWENKIAPRQEGGDACRAAKMRGITAKSPFQIGGSGSVGTGSLRAMSVLRRLRDAGFRVWPFDSARLTHEPPSPLLIEMYARLLTGPVAKSNPNARKLYLANRRKEDAAYAGVSRSTLRKAWENEDAFDALVSCLEMVRWRAEFAALTATSNPVLQLEGITWHPGVQEGME
jgi:hypothetical protein